MAKVTYNLSKFDDTKAISGALCVMVSSSVSDTGTISNMDSDGNTNSSFVGAGICRNIASNTFELTIDSITYQFDGNGEGKSPKSIVDAYKIVLGTVDAKIETSGNAFTSNNTTVTTRGNDGSTTTKVDYTKSSNIIIDSLNARDEFAMKALGEMLSHIDNPSDLSDNEMNYYCNAAYKWAANMLSASANARGTFKQESGESSTSTSTKVTEVDSSSLSSNSDKLLNNLVAILERTDDSEKVNDKTVYFKKVKVQFQELIDILRAYVKGNSNWEDETLGLKDLIKAINDTNSGSNLKDLVEAIKNINITSSDKVSIGDGGLGRSSSYPIYIDSSSNGTFSIGSSGLGRDKDHPLHMTGGGFPTRQSLAAALASASIDSFLTFNTSGAVGYSTLAEVKKAILGWLSDYKDLDALYTALGAKVITTVDARVKAWLDKTTVVSNGSGGYKLSVPSSI